LDERRVLHITLVVVVVGLSTTAFFEGCVGDRVGVSVSGRRRSRLDCGQDGEEARAVSPWKRWERGELCEAS
jgi:hypothetical protein